MSYVYSSPIGDLELHVGIQGVQAVNYLDKRTHSILAAPPKGVLKQLIRQLDEYFGGLRTEFDIPLENDQGTEFQSQVWAQLSRIPYGQVISYAQLAQKIGRSKAVRAVGSANGRNPLPIIVPCHRVIASNQGLGGYSGGLAKKAWLLDHEQR